MERIRKPSLGHRVVVNSETNTKISAASKIIRAFRGKKVVTISLNNKKGETDLGSEITSKYETPESEITKSRFVVGVELYESLKCPLCQALCLDPCLLSCCDAMVCNHCIQQYFGGMSKPCPLCNIPFIKTDKPTKFMTRIYSNLKIKCQFASDDKEVKGCNEILGCFNIVEHQKYCEFNPNCLKKCEKCQIYFEKEKLNFHNCLEELITSYNKVKKDFDNMEIKEEEDNNDPFMIKIKHSLKYT
jgi:hypothetical protein